MSKPRILVTGATGYVGGRLVPRLLARGYAVRCFERNPRHIHGRGWEGAEIVQGDALMPETLTPAFEGIDVAYYLIHSLLHGKKFEELDRRAAENFADAAKRAGVKRIIYLGGMGVDNEQLSPHLHSRHEVGAILRRSGIAVTEFRAAIIVGSGSISFEIIRYLTERLPLIVCTRWIYTKCQPIAIRDVLAYLIAALEEPESIGNIFEIGGANVVTYKDMILDYARERGLKRLLLPLPLIPPAYLAYWISLIAPVPLNIARNLIEGLRNDVFCQNDLALSTFSIKPISYRQALRFALARIREGEVETIWSNSPSLLKPGEVFAYGLETREGMIIETNQEEIAASAATVFKTFCALGGKRGWLFANWAWRLRGILDRLMGGPGMSRLRRHDQDLMPGDVVDFWRVEELQPGRLLRLHAEMKLPGLGWLQFEVLPREGDASKTILTQTIFFEPRGLPGLIYWYALYPFHLMLLSRMCKRIKKLSERRQQTQ